jgi:hypothetical protein
MHKLTELRAQILHYIGVEREMSSGLGVNVFGHKI